MTPGERLALLVVNLVVGMVDRLWVFEELV